MERKISFTANISVWSGKKLTNLRKAIWKHSGVQGKYSCLFTEPTAIKTYFSPQNSLKDFPWQPTINTQNRSFSIDTIPNYPSPNRYYITTKRLFARGRSLLTLSVKKKRRISESPLRNCNESDWKTYHSFLLRALHVGKSDGGGEGKQSIKLFTLTKKEEAER